jgi:hypothetical protein
MILADCLCLEGETERVVKLNGLFIYVIILNIQFDLKMQAGFLVAYVKYL